ncbi:MAG: tRNA preQ1(34) S-adenosylmethionine ribosyltransferase-isomerase QueA [Leptospiraceae bacterium]|nr:tRNA preQ1(34) S-adenosylmethionine ribosyltransferase-isomerase QueA [Leptospiraceae bacterium]
MEIEDLDLYDFDLPSELIARYPKEPPDSCRLLVYDQGKIKHAFFYELPEYLKEGDLLIANDTVVEERRVFLRRKSGARLEAIFLEEPSEGFFEVLLKKASRIREGEELTSEKKPDVIFIYTRQEGKSYLRLVGERTHDLFGQIGEMPIPPYLGREAEEKDKNYYQNFFAKGKLKSAAAPTAALHFTPRVISALESKHIGLAFVSLAIGYGTFASLRNENFRAKKLHEERYEIPYETARILQEKKYRRLIAVGTTSLRVLETVYRKSQGSYESHLSGKTDLFLHPPDEVKSVQGLITNFHLPRSSLLLLVACLIPREELLSLYHEAIQNSYRFFSYGDAMLILKS